MSAPSANSNRCSKGLSEFSAFTFIPQFELQPDIPYFSNL